MKKNVSTLLIKNTFICWTKLKTEKHLTTAKQLIRPPCPPPRRAYFLNDPFIKKIKK